MSPELAGPEVRNVRTHELPKTRQARRDSRFYYEVGNLDCRLSFRNGTHNRSVAMGMTGFEQHIQRQIADKLFVYNFDLKQRKGDHYLEYLGLLAVGCLWLYVGIQMIRVAVKYYG